MSLWLIEIRWSQGKKKYTEKGIFKEQDEAFESMNKRSKEIEKMGYISRCIMGSVPVGEISLYFSLVQSFPNKIPQNT